ncbi:MAG: hypothetical protein WBC04_25090, partial [Candidatus Acidiferrales bacterium]
IKSAQGQQTSVTADLSARKVRANGSVSVEGENELWYTVCHLWLLRKEMLGSAKPSVHQPFRASFLFSPQNS